MKNFRMMDLKLKKISLMWMFLMFGYFLHAQSIEITYCPDYGENALLQGRAYVVNPAEYGVVCYVFVQEGGGWWGPKPSFTNPVTPLQTDGSFSVQFISGGYDEFGTRIFVYLKHNSWPAAPQVSGGELPQYLLDLPYDVIARPHGTRKFSWPNQEYSWTVKESLDGIAMGPGDNLFSAAQENIWIDPQGQLHLKITKTNGLYYSSEIIADTAFGYGKYSFVYNSNPNILDPKSVFGFFTWDDVSPYSSDREAWYREIDFEFSRWGNAGDPTNAQFVIQPWEPAGNLMRYNTGTAPGTIHSFAWYKDSVVFESRKADSSLIKKWIYTGAYLPAPGEENMRINLWLNNKPPVHLDEIILGDYKFQHHLKPPVLSASDGTKDEFIQLNWNGQAWYFYRIFRSATADFSAAVVLNDGWFQGSTFQDMTAETGKRYSYWIRCADNADGSNVTGYISDISMPDAGFISEKQMTSHNQGWSGISSFIDPLQHDPDSLFQPIIGELITLQNSEGAYFPATGVNTLGLWDSKEGYIIKLSQQLEITFSGLPVSEKTLMLEQGWNLIPVLSGCSVPIGELFSGTGVVMVKEVAGWRLWWPEMGVFTLSQLQSGKAYFVLMNDVAGITFPECE